MDLNLQHCELRLFLLVSNKKLTYTHKTQMETQEYVINLVNTASQEITRRIMSANEVLNVKCKYMLRVGTFSSMVSSQFCKFIIS